MPIDLQSYVRYRLLCYFLLSLLLRMWCHLKCRLLKLSNPTVSFCIIYKLVGPPCVCPPVIHLSKCFPDDYLAAFSQ